MALLIFNDAQQSPFGSLMDQSHRRQIASGKVYCTRNHLTAKTCAEVNAALLRAGGQRSQSRLELLVRTIMWLQMHLDGKNVRTYCIVDAHCLTELSGGLSQAGRRRQCIDRAEQGENDTWQRCANVAGVT